MPNYVKPEEAAYAFGASETVTPFYTGNVIYNESVLLIKGDDGKAVGKLQFKPVRILSVRDYTLKHEYDLSLFNVSGRTLTVNDPDRVTYLTENNLQGFEMPEGFYLKDSIENVLTDCILMGAVYTESPFYYGKQIYVSYVYDTKDLNTSLYATYKTSVLPKTQAKLAFGDSLKICATGDSVMEGCSSSKKFNHEPFMDNFMTLTVEELKRAYNYDNITLSNQAVGGKDSGWGAEDAQTLKLANEHPDLLYIHFGINDLGSQNSAESYYINIKKIIDDVHGVNPDCEVVLIKAFNANPDIYDQAGFSRYWKKLDQLASENANVYTLDMFSQSLALIAAKDYYSVTGNGINHVNDFSARLYAMNMIAQLVKYK